jgi:hypothetical protein
MVESSKLMTIFPHAAGTEVMKTPQDVAAILKLHQLGWGKEAIARELGISKNTVRRYLEAGGVLESAKPQRSSLLEGQEEWLAQELRKHRGNAGVVRQRLERQKGIQVKDRSSTMRRWEAAGPARFFDSSILLLGPWTRAFSIPWLIAHSTKKHTATRPGASAERPGRSQRPSARSRQLCPRRAEMPPNPCEQKCEQVLFKILISGY